MERSLRFSKLSRVCNLAPSFECSTSDWCMLYIAAFYPSRFYLFRCLNRAPWLTPLFECCNLLCSADLLVNEIERTLECNAFTISMNLSASMSMVVYQADIVKDKASTSIEIISQLLTYAITGSVSIGQNDAPRSPSIHLPIIHAVLTLCPYNPQNNFGQPSLAPHIRVTSIMILTTSCSAVPLTHSAIHIY